MKVVDFFLEVESASISVREQTHYSTKGFLCTFHLSGFHYTNRRMSYQYLHFPLTLSGQLKKTFVEGVDQSNVNHKNQ